MSGVHGEAAVYRVGLENGPDGVSAWVLDLPGCCAVAPDANAACALLPVVIAEHIAWLDRHGDVTRNAFPFVVEVVGEVTVAAVEAADGEFCFADDLRPATPAAVETAIRRMSYARRDLLELVTPLPDQVLDWLPPAATDRADEWAPEVRSIRAILRHIAEADGYYAANISDGPAPGDEQGTKELFGQRDRAVARLRSLTETDLERQFRHRREWQAAAEQWSVRKTLRRFIHHERFHTKEIEQRLAWLLLGTPQTAGTPVRT